MKLAPKLWGVLAAVTTAATVALIGGFVYAAHTVLNPKQASPIEPAPVAESPATDKASFSIVAIGDSLTKGFGDAEAKGYAGYVRDALDAKTDIPVTLANFAVNGRTTEQLLDDVANRSAIAEKLREADVVLLTIGGNDLYRMGSEISEAELQAIARRVPETLHRVEQLFAKLREWNPEARILYMGLYNPFQEIDAQGQVSLAIQEWNLRVFASALKFRSVSVVPTFDLFHNQGERYLSEDHYHPNAEGYERMAERALQALEGVLP